MIFHFLILGKEKIIKNTDDIEVAERKSLKNKRKFEFKVYFLFYPLLILPLLILLIKDDNIAKLLLFTKSNNSEKDERILGHLPYKEALNESLIEIQPDILVHKEMYSSLLKMKKDAERDGVYLVLLSGFRSIKLQNQIFYSLKSIRNQEASERARVSAPPGYSEHSTGFAIDFGDAYERSTDFEQSFENTNAFKWLKKNAARYHFKLSFDKKQSSVDYEPWHWRYEGSIEALKIFESSNRNSF